MNVLICNKFCELNNKRKEKKILKLYLGYGFYTAWNLNLGFIYQLDFYFYWTLLDMLLAIQQIHTVKVNILN